MMTMLFNKVLGENEKCAFLLIKKLKELFGQLSRHLEFRNGKIYFFAGSKKGFKFGF